METTEDTSYSANLVLAGFESGVEGQNTEDTEMLPSLDIRPIMPAKP